MSYGIPIFINFDIWPIQGEGLQNASDFFNLPVTWRRQLQMFLYDFYVSPKGGHAPPKGDMLPQECFLYCHKVYILSRLAEYGVCFLWDYKMLVWKIWKIRKMEGDGNIS